MSHPVANTLVIFDFIDAFSTVHTRKTNTVVYVYFTVKAFVARVRTVATVFV